jgi:hypothetical protein
MMKNERYEPKGFILDIIGPPGPVSPMSFTKPVTWLVGYGMVI